MSIQCPETRRVARVGRAQVHRRPSRRVRRQRRALHRPAVGGELEVDRLARPSDEAPRRPRRRPPPSHGRASPASAPSRPRRRGTRSPYRWSARAGRSPA